MKRSGFLKTLAAIGAGLGLAPLAVKAEPEKKEVELTDWFGRVKKYPVAEKGPFLFDQKKLQARIDELKKLGPSLRPGATLVLYPNAVVDQSPRPKNTYQFFEDVWSSAITISDAKIIDIQTVRITLSATDHSEDGVRSYPELRHCVLAEYESCWVITDVYRVYPFAHEFVMKRIK